LDRAQTAWPARDWNFAFGNGQNAEWPVPPQTIVDPWFGGADVRNTRLTVQGDGYTGHAISQQFATIMQFGRIQRSGGWAQVGYDFTTH
jgi:hypothetical protein